MKYQHDCDNCEFVGTFHGLDTYIHVAAGDIEPKSCGVSLISRFGDEGSDYQSASLDVFESLIRHNNNIGLFSGKSIPFRDYLASEECTDYHQAWLIALAYYYATHAV